MFFTMSMTEASGSPEFEPYQEYKSPPSLSMSATLVVVEPASMPRNAAPLCFLISANGMATLLWRSRNSVSSFSSLNSASSRDTSLVSASLTASTKTG